ncbi:hypothetical protein SAMN02745157_0284 [Kaistia soli DSM 19436]|uniref:Uncharacterized protein n=1 Tax=Kaistia soli DSM 19436 TaxID=1122133 RepID=A0A1M5Q0M7_9HYPH|nr:hypothetical protein SAMN02745157_0284 [Kaistia soli DSM 19436]
MLRTGVAAHSTRATRSPVETADRLRHEIDRGAASDKVSFPDPAASPLGTDDEAGGHGPEPERVALAARHELGRPSGAAPAGRSEGSRKISGGPTMGVRWIVLALVVFLVSAGLWFASQ